MFFLVFLSWTFVPKVPAKSRPKVPSVHWKRKKAAGFLRGLAHELRTKAFQPGFWPQTLYTTFGRPPEDS